MTKQEIIDALLVTEPAYQELATRIANSEILFSIYRESDDPILKNRIVSLLIMQQHPDLSSILPEAFETGDISVKTTIVAGLSSQTDTFLAEPKIRAILSNALGSEDVSLLKFAIGVVTKRNLQGFEADLDMIAKENSNEYLVSLIKNG